jgi:tyrosyl-tRNA synthetase
VLNIKSGTPILEALKSANLGVSNGDIKRTIEQGGVEFDGQKITDAATPINTTGVLKFGKKTFRKINI